MHQSELELINDIASFTHDPLNYSIYAFPWGEKELVDSQGPRAWQADTFNIIKDHLSNPDTRFTPLRIAVASGHGIGKSALIAMLTKWGLDTCEDTRIVITANTESQLLTKTSPRNCEVGTSCHNTRLVQANVYRSHINNGRPQ